MSGNAKRILLIDDDVDVHTAVKLTLEPEGYELTCCLTGPAGMETMRATHPDLVLLDIMLSTPSEGFHLAYEMKADDELKDIPVIIISAIGKKMGMDFARELGSDYVQAERFLEKPFDAQTLRTAVRELLEGKE